MKMTYVWPLEFRIGSTGFFCPGIYCGIGVAYGRELTMVGVPGEKDIVPFDAVTLTDTTPGKVGKTHEVFILQMCRICSRDL